MPKNKHSSSVTLKNWGILPPSDYSHDKVQVGFVSKISSWVELFPNHYKNNLIFENINMITLYNLWWLELELLKQDKIKRRVGTINFGEFMGNPMYSAESRSLQEETNNIMTSCDLVIIEDLDLMVGDSQLKSKAHWILSNLIKKKTPIILVLSGTVNDLMDEMSKLTILRLSNNSLIIE